MRLHRFYVTQPLGEDVVIDDVSLIFQWTKVFRYQPGDFVILFNGDGNDYSYSLTKATKTSCTLIRTKSVPSYVPSLDVTLCLSLIKKDNFELVVQKATELGITTIIPILTSRSEKKNLSFERLERIAIESTEQCGRGTIPTIKKISTLEEVLSTLNDNEQGIIFTLDGLSLKELSVLPRAKHLHLFIGPEGGWSDEDMNIFNNHHSKILMCSLGKTVLRAETAAIVATAFITI